VDLEDLIGDSLGGARRAGLAVEARRQKHRVGGAFAVRRRDLEVVCELLDRQDFDILADGRV